MIEKGISVVICTHNGAAKISPVLEHLLKQQPDGIRWEVIIVDNASTDNLTPVIESVWKSPTPLKIIPEEHIGLSYARQTGFNAANYAFVCFVDDDNLLLEDYLQTAFHTMESHPDAGAVGGFGIAPDDLVQPFWFQRYQANYAIGPQAKSPGRVDHTNAVLWGAGICIRKEAWFDLLNNNFTMRMTGRSGKSLLSGEDSEICYMLRLCGWQLYYDDNLRYIHRIAQQRVTWNYLCKLKRGFGAASVYLGLYRNLLAIKLTRSPMPRQCWICMLIKDIWTVITHPFAFAATLFGLFEGNDKVIRMHALFGSISMRLKLRSKLGQIAKEMLANYSQLLNP